ncbi:succinate dehydrogenase, hydrophobic membrane anchor protein [Aurantiacibacter aquimixticola]|uniref:Succinate dehydrogenase hydrophobic membrane anchor subunit n=1 Tax=Aurantiacibacter aquimixticola TaxID=1958945 RepID=A0A419RSK9_9SPHN|nr:succinate dehydrogenase, hydrophobic membrane anchor protein [Aurantiacibacter aquimixticola]RJY08768.1 succinate dehydrogenase, hydrophobic membrane anchor protein [Aurantiacibacter aquimixticola]
MGNGTSIGRVRGLGAAHEGPHHWLVQRFTAVGNLITVLFLIGSLIMLPNLDHATVSEWIADPVPAFMMALLVISTFWHARLGLQVLVEDYVHTPGNKFASLLVLNFWTFAGAGFGLFCIARLAIGGGAA